MVLGVVQVNDQSTRIISWIHEPFELIVCLDPRCVGTCATHLHGSQHPQHETQLDRRPHYRHLLTSYYAHWLAPPGLSRIWRARSGTPHVDTGGGVRAPLASYVVSFSLICSLFVRVLFGSSLPPSRMSLQW
jgi:hypothetical protein